MLRKFSRTLMLVVVIAGLAGLVACKNSPPAKSENVSAPAVNATLNAMSSADSSERQQGYLSSSLAPNSSTLAPPPPASGTPAMAQDEAVNRSALSMQGSPRFQLAANDAVLTFPTVAQTFSCALDLPLSPDNAPKTFALLRRVSTDAGRSTSQAKDKYRRTRPFVVNGKPTCTPDSEPGLRNNGSYPSGHAAIGYAFGLVLSEVVPERGDALVARGRAFGQSRLVCNVHWQSDVLEGQMIASAVVARLNAVATFRNDVEAAHSELQRLSAESNKSDPAFQAKCEAENQTLKSWPQ